MLVATSLISAVLVLRADDGEAMSRYRITIPNLASEPVQPNIPRATGDPAAGLVVISHVGTAVLGSLTAFGEIQNDSDFVATNAVVSGTAVSAAGATLGMTSVSALTTQIAAHGTGLFQIAFVGVTDASVRVTVGIESFTTTAGAVASLGVTVTAGGPRPLELVTYDPKTHERIVTNSETSSVLNGTITNGGPYALGEIDVLIAFYDVAGRVALIIHAGPIATAFPAPGPAKLLAGRSGTFTAHLANADYLSIAGPVTTAGFVNAVISS